MRLRGSGFLIRHHDHHRRGAGQQRRGTHRRRAQRPGAPQHRSRARDRPHSDVADRPEESQRLVCRLARSADCGRRRTAASPSRRSSTTGGSFTLCCVVVDPKDSNIVWLGTGENTSQRSAHFGDGVYKSTDAGKTWKRVGLAASEHIGKIADRSAQLQRRLRRRAGAAVVGRRRARPFKTTDGGATWKPSPDDQRRHRRHRRRVRSEESRRALRVGLSAPPRRRPDDWRRSGRRHLQDHQRRQDLDEADQGPADGRHGPHRARRSMAARSPPRCSRSSTPSATEAGLLSIGRCRRQLGAHRTHAAAGADGAARRRTRRSRPAAAEARRRRRRARRDAAPFAAGGAGRRLLPRRRRAVLPRALRRSRTGPTRSGR